MNIHEVLEYGSIIAHNEEYDIFITINGAYFNLWLKNENRDYTNTECFAVEPTQFNASNGIIGADITKLQDRARAIITEYLAESEEE